MMELTAQIVRTGPLDCEIVLTGEAAHDEECAQCRRQSFVVHHRCRHEAHARPYHRMNEYCSHMGYTVPLPVGDAFDRVRSHASPVASVI